MNTLDPSELYGYEILLAVRASQLNNDLERLFANAATFQQKGIILEWQHLPKEGDPVPETVLYFDPPKIEISQEENSNVEFLFPFDTSIEGENSYIHLDGKDKCLNGCAMRCTVNISHTVLAADDIEADDDGVCQIKECNSMMSQDLMTKALKFIKSSAFDLYHFFVNLNKLKYAGNVHFDDSQSEEPWTDADKIILQEMVKELFLYFQRANLSIPIGLLPAARNEKSTESSGLLYTNLRVLPYFQGRDDPCNGILYAMVCNPQGKLPPKQPFETTLCLLKKASTMFIKWNTLYEIGLKQVGDKIAEAWKPWIKNHADTPIAFPLGPRNITTGHFYVAFEHEEPLIKLGMDYEISFPTKDDAANVLNITVTVKGEVDSKLMDSPKAVLTGKSRFTISDGKIHEENIDQKLAPKPKTVDQAVFFIDLLQETVFPSFFENFAGYHWQAGALNMFANDDMEYTELTFTEVDGCPLMCLQATLNVQ